MYKIITLLIIIDYLLTYLGMQQNIIYEANPLMVGFMNLSFTYGFILRIIIAVGLIYAIFKNRNKKLYTKTYDCITFTTQRKITSDKALYVILGIQLVVYFFHAIWIVATLIGGI